MKNKKTVLIVDDDADLQHTYQLAVSAAGYNTLLASDSIEAERMLSTERPDLILMDIMMEEVDAGLVFAERFAKDHPMILLSSISDASVKVFDADKIPVKTILQKPVEPKVLQDAIRNAIES